MMTKIAFFLCLILSLTSAFKARQAAVNGATNGQMVDDVQNTINDANNVLTDSQNMWNDAMDATQGMINQIALQTLNGAGTVAGMAGGVAPPAANLPPVDGDNGADDAPVQVVDPIPAPAARRLQQAAPAAGGNLAQDIGNANQDALGYLGDMQGTANDITNQVQLAANNAIQATEQAFGVANANVAAPDRLQQAPPATPADVIQDSQNIAQDYATVANDIMQVANDALTQGVLTTNGVMQGLNPLAAAPAQAVNRRLQRIH